MQVFKTTLRIIFRSPLYLLLYIVLFGLFGLVLSVSLSNMLPAEQGAVNREDARPTVAVIDRDHSEVSQGITDFLASRSTPVTLEDNTRALQDATARNLASYILIIPEGFGEAFLEAARTGSQAPELDTVVNFAQADGILMNLLTNRYLQSLSMAAALLPEASTADLLATTASAAELQATVKSASLSESPTTNQGDTFYFLWISYPLSLGLIVLTGKIFATFRDGELRRRNFCAPHSTSKINARVALGSVSLILMAWAFMVLLYLLPFTGGLDMLVHRPLTFALLAFAALIYALVPYSIGFLLSQCGFKEAALNGAANILSLAFSFLSGIFMGSVTLLGPTVQVIARAIPAYWYSEAVTSLTTGGLTSGLLATYFGNLGIVALFAVALFSVGLLISRRSAQSYDAGGNPAAEGLAD